QPPPKDVGQGGGRAGRERGPRDTGPRRRGRGRTQAGGSRSRHRRRRRDEQAQLCDLSERPTERVRGRQPSAAVSGSRRLSRDGQARLLRSRPPPPQDPPLPPPHHPPPPPPTPPRPH